MTYAVQWRLAIKQLQAFYCHAASEKLCYETESVQYTGTLVQQYMMILTSGREWHNTEMSPVVVTASVRQLLSKVWIQVFICRWNVELFLCFCPPFTKGWDACHLHFSAPWLLASVPAVKYRTVLEQVLSGFLRYFSVTRLPLESIALSRKWSGSQLSPQESGRGSLSANMAGICQNN